MSVGGGFCASDSVCVSLETFDQTPGEWQNPILGIPMREAAEPGGYRLWHDETGVWYAYYDLAGQETAIRIWSVVARTRTPQSG